jgi:Ni/Co efflux regulator RcnB
LLLATALATSASAAMAQDQDRRSDGQQRGDIMHQATPDARGAWRGQQQPAPQPQRPAPVQSTAPQSAPQPAYRGSPAAPTGGYSGYTQPQAQQPQYRSPPQNNWNQGNRGPVQPQGGPPPQTAPQPGVQYNGQPTRGGPGRTPNDWGHNDYGRTDPGRAGQRNDNDRRDGRYDRDRHDDGRRDDWRRDGRRDRDDRHRWSYRGYEYNSFRISPFYYPRGWEYRSWRVGERLPYMFLSSTYFIDNWYDFDLPQPPYGYHWARFGPDAVLVNNWSGEVVDVIYGIFYW